MFQLTMAGGMNQGFPDVCLTPTPVGPVPVPYPNISTGATANPATTALTVLTDGMPSLTLRSMIPLSNGDQPGVNGGVASGMIMGPTTFTVGSTAVLQGGAPAVRLTSMTGQNGLSMNCPGVALAPSQVKVLILS